VSRLEKLDSKIGFLSNNIHSIKHMHILSIIEELDITLRECYAREIIAYHELECPAPSIGKTNLCTCKDVADLIIGEVLGDEVGKFEPTTYL
jgi:hypothetical protein